MTTQYYVNNGGAYLGGFAGNTFKVPAGAIEVPSAPKDARALWDGAKWNEPILTVEEKEVKLGVTLEAKVEALWNKIVNDDSTELDVIKSKKEDAKK